MVSSNPLAATLIQPIAGFIDKTFVITGSEVRKLTEMGLRPYVTPRALEKSELPGVVSQYIDGAQRAKIAGFDGIEIHNANGYLLDQFLRDGTNHRTDVYGGAIANRARLAQEVTQAVTKVRGSGRVGIRFSSGGIFNDMHEPFRKAAGRNQETEDGDRIGRGSV